MKQDRIIFKQEDLYFTSDWHLGHDGMLKFKHKSGRILRPFSSPEEMNRTIIDNMNSIPKNSHLFLLGDVAMGNRKEAFKLLDQIECKNIYLIRGNHDRKIAMKIPERWVWIKDYYKISVEDPEAVNKRGSGIQDICLFHYPITSWEKAIHGTWHLYGHCHGNLDDPKTKSFDVGVDCHNYKPLSYQEVKDIMKSKELPYTPNI